MTKFKFALTLLCVTFFLASCNDLFVSDLSKKSVSVLAPANNALLTNATVTFWWNPLNEATEYTIQIVKPSFSNVQILILDSTITSNKLFVSLTPGSYQWRIKGSAGMTNSTSFQVYSFTVDSNLNIVNQTVVLTSPANNAVTNHHNINFTWSNVFSATKYTFMLTNGAGSISVDTIVTTNSLYYSGLTDGSYTWKVNAMNGLGSSAFSTSTFSIDSAAPPTPTAFSASNYAFGDSFSLHWTRATPPSGLSYYDTVVIYSDSFQSNAVRYNAITAASPITYSDSLPTGTYYTKVATKDNAGNVSAFTALLRFILP